MMRVYGLWFRVYHTFVNVFNKLLDTSYKRSLKCYKTLRVQGLGCKVYNTLVNDFNKDVNKSYITLFKML